MTPAFWPDRRVFVTGHTGFKGAWLTTWLSALGARVAGYALAPKDTPNLFERLADRTVATTIGDVGDLPALRQAMIAAQPEIIFHLAAQSLVRPSYIDPVGTYATNVMGTVHVLEAARHIPSVRAIIIVTSDKCYENDGRNTPYAEHDALGGHDPYSNSKGCAELVTAAYRSSFFAGQSSCAIASARAGNVIGGGDWSIDRLIPDMLRAHDRGEDVMIRSPNAIRPWQHVLEPLSGYLDLAEALCGTRGHTFAEGWNFGPDPQDSVPVCRVVEQFSELLGIAWQQNTAPQPPEAGFLSIDSSKARRRLNWHSRLSTRDAISWTAQWHKQFQSGSLPRDLVRDQIAAYEDASRRLP
jgi:CDP-glucose 4,6-dehydratase